MYNDDIRNFRISIFAENKELVKTKYPVSAKTKKYSEKIVLKDASKLKETKIFVLNEDCLIAAEMLNNLGYKVGVLNMASPICPGGGVKNGSGAQEENLCRRSNLYWTLPYDAYPFKGDTSALFSPSVTVFRQGEKERYAFLPKPFDIGVITVAALRHPFLVGGLMQKEDILHTKERIRTILRVGYDNNLNALVLSAFGCGAFANPPLQMATLFKEVFKEPEFQNRFDVIVFAIINDINAKAGGNFTPFASIFSKV